MPGTSAHLFITPPQKSGIYLYALLSNNYGSRYEVILSRSACLPDGSMPGSGNGGTLHPDTGMTVLPWENLDWWIPADMRGYPEKEL